MAALPQQVAHAQQRDTGVRAHPRRRRRGRASPRAKRWPACPSRASTNCSSGRRRRAPAIRSAAFPRSCAARRCPASSHRPGPIYEPEGTASDYWRAARAMFAAGFRAGDLVHNAFSYHMTPGAFIMESGAHAVGCTVFPGGSRADRAAAAGDRRAASPTPIGHAELPAHPGREGRRDRQRRLQHAQRPDRRRGACRPACATGSPNTAWPSTRATPRPTWASSPTKRRRAKAWCWTRA